MANRVTGRFWENFDGLWGALVYCGSSPDVPTEWRGQLISPGLLGRL
jgi:hypothetical protein